MNLIDVYQQLDIELEKAKGTKVWDTNGIEYLDFYGGHVVISIGHSHPDYVAALTEQLNAISFYSNAIKNKQQELLAKKLGEISGYSEYQLFLSNSGAEANENAFKIASFYNQRKKIIAFNGAFHGRTSLAVSTTDNSSIQAEINENKDIIFLPLNDIEAFQKTANSEICCVIIEGIQGVAGINEPEKNFLQEVERMCNQHNIVLILDEIQSGYGRTGKFFAHQHHDIKADIITVAKGMGNGFPIAGTIISPKFLAKKEQLGTTFGGNYLASIAGLAVLEVMEKENLISNASKNGDYFIQELKQINKIKAIRGRGLMIGIELETNCQMIREKLLTEFKIFTGSSSNKNVVRILPPLTVKKKEIDYFLNALKAVLS